MTRFPAIETMANAMTELRGLDRSLILDLEAASGDAAKACQLIGTVLDGFLMAPIEVQAAIIVAGGGKDIPGWPAVVYENMRDEQNQTRLDQLLTELDTRPGGGER